MISEHDQIPDGACFVNVSQMKDWVRCHRLWGFVWGLGISTTGDATDFGIAVHGYSEDWLRAGVMPPNPGPVMMQRKANGGAVTRFPAVIAVKGFDHIPPPQFPELQIETAWVVRHPSGIWFKGTIDFFLPATVQSPWNVQVETVYELNPETNYREPVTTICALVGDHKTCASARFALTRDDLPTDLQCLLYSWATFIRNPELQYVKCRWVYYSKAHNEGGWAVDVVVPRAFAMAKFDEVLLPLALEIQDASKRVIGLPTVDPRKLPAGYPKDSKSHKLHVMNQFPYEGHRDDRCMKYGGCWFRGTCFNFDFQSLETRGESEGTCTESCSVGTCVSSQTRNPNRRDVPALGTGVQSDQSSGVQTMSNANVPDAAALAAANAKIGSDPIIAPWKRYDDPTFAAYVHDGTRAIPLTEYADTIHQPPAPAAAINPPPAATLPGVPMAPTAPAAPVAPQAPQVPAAPQAPAAPSAPPAPPAAPSADAGESNEQNALYQQLQAKGLIPANRAGRKPGLPKLRAMLAWNFTIDQFAAWETAEKAKGAASTYDSMMAAFTPAPSNPPPAVQAPAAATPVPGPQAPAPGVPTAPTPVPTATPSAAPQAPAPAAPGATPAGSKFGFILAINSTYRGNARTVDFNREILPGLQTRIANTDVTMDNGAVRRFGSYGEIPYGRGTAMMNAALTDWLNQNAAQLVSGTVVTVDATTNAGRDALDVLRAAAASEFRGA